MLSNMVPRKLHPVRLFCIFRDPRVKQRFAAQIEADVGECIAPAGMGQVEFSAAAGDPADAGNAFEPVVSGRGERQIGEAVQIKFRHFRQIAVRHREILKQISAGIPFAADRMGSERFKTDVAEKIFLRMTVGGIKSELESNLDNPLVWTQYYPFGQEDFKTVNWDNGCYSADSPENKFSQLKNHRLHDVTEGNFYAIPIDTIELESEYATNPVTYKLMTAFAFPVYDGLMVFAPSVLCEKLLLYLDKKYRENAAPIEQVKKLLHQVKNLNWKILKTWCFLKTSLSLRSLISEKTVAEANRLSFAYQRRKRILPKSLTSVLFWN